MSDNTSPPLKWQIRLFGALEVVSPEGKVTAMRGARAGALLAYLALRLDQPCPREMLAELFWPESDPTSKRTRLRQEIATLRALFSRLGADAESPLVAGTKAVALRADAVETDAGRFLCELKAADAAPDPAAKERRLEQAIALYRGDLLQEYSAVDVPERPQYSQRYETALRQLAALLKARSAFSEAEARLKQLIQYEPLLEEAHTDLIQLYAEMGQPTQIRRQYQELEQSLRQSFSAQPTNATKQLVAELLQTSPAHGPLPGAQPVSPPDIVQAGAGDLPVPHAETPGEPVTAHAAGFAERRVDPVPPVGRHEQPVARPPDEDKEDAACPAGISPAFGTGRFPPADPLNPAFPDDIPPVYVSPPGRKAISARALVSPQLLRIIVALAVLLLLFIFTTRPHRAHQPPPLEYGKEDAIYVYTPKPGEKDDSEARAVIAGPGNTLYTAGLIDTDHDNKDILVVKLDENLNEIWSKHYPSPERDCDRANCLTLGTDGGLYVAGETYVPDTRAVPGGWRTVLLKYDAENGDLLWWQRSPYPMKNPDQRIYVAPLPQGGVYVGCTALDGKVQKMAVLRYDPAGKLLWNRRFPTDSMNDTTLNHCVVDTDGNLYACGTAVRGMTPRGPDTDWIVLRYLPDGTLDWHPYRDGPGHGGDDALQIYLTRTGVRVAGIFDTGDPVQGGHGACLGIAQYSFEGTFNTMSWDPMTGPNALFTSYTVDWQGNSLIAGRTLLPDGAGQAMLEKFDPNGHFLWRKPMQPPDGFHTTQPGPMLSGSSGEMVMAGRISEKMDHEASADDSLLWLTRTAGDGTLERQWGYRNLPGRTWVQSAALDQAGRLVFAGQASVGGGRHRLLVVRYPYPTSRREIK